MLLKEKVPPRVTFWLTKSKNLSAGLSFKQKAPHEFQFSLVSFKSFISVILISIYSLLILGAFNWVYKHYFLVKLNSKGNPVSQVPKHSSLGGQTDEEETGFTYCLQGWGHHFLFLVALKLDDHDATVKNSEPKKTTDGRTELWVSRIFHH